MSQAFRTPLSLVWLLLVAATVASSVAGWGGSGSDVTGASLMAIAFLKVYLVGSWFMEVRTAPTWLRAVFASWCLVVGAALVTLVLAL